MVVVCPPILRLARRKVIAPSDLNGENFVAFDADLRIRKAIDRYLRRHETRVKVVMEFDNIETIKQAIAIGAGVSILPSPTILKEVGNRTLAASPLAASELTRPLGIIHRRGKVLTPTNARFLDLLRRRWPELLDAEGCLDPAERRNLLQESPVLAAQLERDDLNSDVGRLRDLGQMAQLAQAGQAWRLGSEGITTLEVKGGPIFFGEQLIQPKRYGFNLLATGDNYPDALAASAAAAQVGADGRPLGVGDRVPLPLGPAAGLQLEASPVGVVLVIEVHTDSHAAALPSWSWILHRCCRRGRTSDLPQVGRQ